MTHLFALENRSGEIQIIEVTKTSLAVDRILQDAS
jgi:hypothetical protein